MARSGGARGPLKSTDAPVEPRRGKRRPTPNRWCGRHAGREHDWKWVDWHVARGMCNTPQGIKEHEELHKRMNERNEDKGPLSWKRYHWHVQVCQECCRQGKMRESNLLLDELGPDVITFN